MKSMKRVKKMIAGVIMKATYIEFTVKMLEMTNKSKDSVLRILGFYLNLLLLY